MKGYLRVLVVGGDDNPWIGFVVPEQNVVARLQRFDPFILQQQRFAFRSCETDIYLPDARNHAHDALDLGARVEIAAHPLAQVLRLADIQRRAVTVLHDNRGIPVAAGDSVA